MMKDYYVENAIKTASPAKLVEMLYERSVELLKEAKEAMQGNNFTLANEKIGKVQDIITELNISLDIEKGGEIARSLRSLYNYMYKTLIEASLRKEVEKIDEILYYAEQLLEAWRSAMKTVRSPSSQNQRDQNFNISV